MRLNAFLDSVRHCRMKSTCFINIFNEEYLLPFWLHHHKDIFDKIVVVDYRSTDASMELCRRICPSCEIRTTRNEYFGAVEIDKEFMDLEQETEGIKMVLNVTEFLITEKPLKEIFLAYTDPVSLEMIVKAPHSSNTYMIQNNYELFHNLLNDDIRYSEYRGSRQIHTFPHGNYTWGRHSTNHPTVRTEEMFVLWFGFYPMNDALLKRKLQIQQNMPQSDKQRGLGFQHLWSREQMLHENAVKAEQGKPLQELCPKLYDLLQKRYRGKRFLVTGGCGFIGSHMVDKLVSLGHTVHVFDTLRSGSMENLNPNAQFQNVDICTFDALKAAMEALGPLDGIFHFAAIARTPWCIEDPLLCYQTNVLGTLHVLEAARQLSVKRVVLSSSNVVYAFMTPYRTSKEALEDLGTTYHDMYGMSVVSLRYSNVYGPRQSEQGPSPNVFAALRKSKKELGKLLLTGDGTQTRNYTHVRDIVNGNLLAMFHTYCGVLDLCTGISVPLNEAAAYFECPIEYIPERPGDVKHILQSPEEAFATLGWKATVSLQEGIKDVL